MSDPSEPQGLNAAQVWSLIFAALLGVFALLLIADGLSALFSKPESTNVSAPSDNSGGITNDSTDIDGISALVPWEIYDPSVKTDIERMAAEGDCLGLDEQYWNAHRNNDVVFEKTGQGNGPLIGYISALQESTGCG